MLAKKWKSRLDMSQTEYLSLIASCLLGVQILATVRDVGIIGLDMPTWLAWFNVFLIALMISMVICVQTREIPNRFSHNIVMAAMLSTGAKAIAVIVVQAEPLPFYMAILLFSCSLCFLSYRILLLTSGIVTLAWAVIVPYVLTPAEIISTFVAMVMAAVLSVVVLRRRILSLVHLYELQ
jgi:hypothetical protein